LIFKGIIQHVLWWCAEKLKRGKYNMITIIKINIWLGLMTSDEEGKEKHGIQDRTWGLNKSSLMKLTKRPSFAVSGVTFCCKESAAKFWRAKFWVVEPLTAWMALKRPSISPFGYYEHRNIK
jgi:hypothetical protein